MKTKKLFLMAAVLLSSVSAFAQSGNNEPLKGDVNEDGTVDVADITAVIKIMRDGGGTAEQPKNYWYVGHVTNEQFEDPTLLTTIINNGTSITSATGPSTLTMPTTTGDVLVYIYPTVWGTPNIVDSTGYGTGDGNYLEDAGLTPPSGYDIRYWDGDSSVRGKTLSITWSK